MEYFHLMTHNLVYYLEGIDYKHRSVFPTGLQVDRYIGVISGGGDSNWYGVLFCWQSMVSY